MGNAKVVATGVALCVAISVLPTSSFAISASQAAATAPVGFIQAMVDLASVDGFGPLPADLSDKGIIIVMNRATIGVGDPDPVFEPHAQQAWAAGLTVGAYHVPFPTHGADAQAADFVNTVKKVCKAGSSVLLAIDWEEVCVKRQGPKGKCAIKRAGSPEQIESLVRAIKQRTNNAGILIYTRSDIIQSNRSSVENALSAEPLWVAQYWGKIHGQPVNYFPNRNDLMPWSDWDFWQWTQGNSPNLSTRISATYGKGKSEINPDTSLYNGLPQTLHDFLTRNSWQCPA